MGYETIQGTPSTLRNLQSLPTLPPVSYVHCPPSPWIEEGPLHHLAMGGLTLSLSHIKFPSLCPVSPLKETLSLLLCVGLGNREVLGDFLFNKGGIIQGKSADKSLLWLKTRSGRSQCEEAVLPEKRMCL